MAIQTVKEIVHERLQEASGAALKRFRDAVRPIYGATGRGDPEHIGTALLLHLREGKFLLTAAHVIDWSATTTLYLGAENLASLEFEALVSAAPNGDRNKDQADFAVARLDADLVSALSGAKFITEEEISRSVAPTEGRAYTCLGYPNSKNKVNPYKGTKVRPALGIYTSLGRSASLLQTANDVDHILVDHDAKFSCDASGNQVNSIALPGFSGGAVIDLGKISPENLDADLDPKLAALLIEGHAREKVILGTRLTVILGAVQKHLQVSITGGVGEA